MPNPQFKILFEISIYLALANGTQGKAACDSIWNNGTANPATHPMCYYASAPQDSVRPLYLPSS